MSGWHQRELLPAGVLLVLFGLVRDLANFNSWTLAGNSIADFSQKVNRLEDSSYTLATAPAWRAKCKPDYLHDPANTDGLGHVDKSGAYVLRSCLARYRRDNGLVQAMLDLVGGGSVIELGAGCGCYTGPMLDSGRVQSIMAFDGVSNIGSLTSELVRHADLTKDLGSLLPLHDWTICLEVIEHVPKQYEDRVLQNVVANVKTGLIFSWLNSLAGESHVNVQGKAYAIEKLRQLGFRYDDEATRIAKSKLSGEAEWFKDTLLIFYKV